MPTRHIFRKIVVCMLMDLLLYAVCTATLTAAEGERTLFDFDHSQTAAQWRSINDDVMGGRSEGTSRIIKQGLFVFSGNLSLENRGGFASVRCRPTKLDLSAFEAIVLRARGDGRTYYCNLHTPTLRTAFSHRAAFATKANEWRDIRIPIKNFHPAAYGRRLPREALLDPGRVQSLGFTIADKKAGPFTLEIDWIKVVPPQAQENDAKAASATQ